MSAGYENVPATEMLATHCAVCGRPLIDAISVEAAVGPECRKRHGHADAQSEPNWVAATVVLRLHERERLDWGFPAGWNEDAHKAANVLVRRIAIAQHDRPGHGLRLSSKSAVVMTQALHHLGFQKLARRIGDRLVKIDVTVEGDTYVLRAPYSEATLPILRAVPGRWWDPKRKVNTFPMRARAAFWRALQQAFPGEHARGPNGYFHIGGAT